MNALIGLTSLLMGMGASASQSDVRNIRTGFEIPSAGYCDQPYVVITADGGWLCTMTTGPGLEGEGGQHVVSTTSRDYGKTWTPLVDIEPAGELEASWAMPLSTPGGRVYAFYVYNGDRIHTLGEREHIRADTLGWYCYRYTDDGGKTWSERRYRLPMRVTTVDRSNDWGGEVQIFWGIGKPITFNGSAMLAFTKIGKYMLEESEGWFFRSDNVLSESDPEKHEWELVPEGDHGLRNPEFGSIQSEQNIVPMNDGGIYCMYRTTTGYPCHAYSRDGGRSWT
ncbi:MAG TPA: exo-alpha-sialidase, partial [Candidatus Hydrogenedentes bacterium]|nr:exo-alpha-sialidase [Candidatus Hydrogenedentota bacterium]